MVQENVETLKIVDDEEIQHLDAEATQQPGDEMPACHGEGGRLAPERKSNSAVQSGRDVIGLSSWDRAAMSFTPCPRWSTSRRSAISTDT
jgi:hypothetical protein